MLEERDNTNTHITFPLPTGLKTFILRELSKIVSDTTESLTIIEKIVEDNVDIYNNLMQNLEPQLHEDTKQFVNRIIQYKKRMCRDGSSCKRGVNCIFNHVDNNANGDHGTEIYNNDRNNNDRNNNDRNNNDRNNNDRNNNDRNNNDRNYNDRNYNDINSNNYNKVKYNNNNDKNNDKHNDNSNNGKNNYNNEKYREKSYADCFVPNRYGNERRYGENYNNEKRFIGEKRMKPTRDDTELNEIILNNVPSHILEDEITRYCEQFGHCTTKKLKDLKFLVCFKTHEAARSLLTSKDFILNDESIKRYFNRNKKVDEDDIEQLFDDLEDQMSMIRSETQHEGFKKLNWIVNRLKSVVVKRGSPREKKSLLCNSNFVME